MRCLHLALFTLLAATGCQKHSAVFEQMVANGTSEESATLYEEGLALWAERDDAAQMKSALDKFEASYRSDPTNREAAVMLTRGYYWYGDVKVSTEEEKLATWDNAVQWGGRCLAVNSEFAELLTKKEKEVDAIRVMTKDDAGCLYFYASALGKWAKLQGFGTLLKHKDTVKAFIAKVDELDHTYFHAGPDRYWGAYYAIAPSFAGGDLPTSKKHFEQSLADQPDYLGTKVLMAANYAVKMQDPALFEKLLNEVIAADADAIPEAGPENRAEQVKAKDLLSKKSDFFAN
ncbi:MAG: hypothetical protein CL930_09080 [Deltaproteobacteria bacterium]|nr:hypothetical protein [Deltaproteobacteria bacterium]